ncbi:Phospholipid-transporting ATPase 3 [Phytophthora nicotianae]|nr:Phospholipid-transporting ATPase 3 [Phytophthora nicotianae]
MSDASSSSSDSVNLSAALTALKVSLKRDLESFAPPTPAVSPVHGRGSAKRARFDFESIEEESEVDAEKQQRVKTPTASPPKTVNALLAVSSRIKFELEKRRRRERERAQKPRRRKQLSYFAIVGAFQRAAHEREVAVQVECVVEASTD